MDNRIVGGILGCLFVKKGWMGNSTAAWCLSLDFFENVMFGANVRITYGG